MFRLYNKHWSTQYQNSRNVHSSNILTPKIVVVGKDHFCLFFCLLQEAENILYAHLIYYVYSLCIHTAINIFSRPPYLAGHLQWRRAARQQLCWKWLSWVRNNWIICQVTDASAKTDSLICPWCVWLLVNYVSMSYRLGHPEIVSIYNAKNMYKGLRSLSETFCFVLKLVCTGIGTVNCHKYWLWVPRSVNEPGISFVFHPFFSLFSLFGFEVPCLNRFREGWDITRRP